MSTFHDVIAAFEGAEIDMRKAYWGHPSRPGECCNALKGDEHKHRTTDGDLRFIIRLDGRDLEIEGVRKEDGAIVVAVR